MSSFPLDAGVPLVIPPRKICGYRICRCGCLIAKLCVPFLLSEHLDIIEIPGEETTFTVAFYFS